MVAYRFDPDYTTAGRHYTHPLLSWPTVIAGAVAAVAIGFLLNVLGLAIGASAFNAGAIAGGWLGAHHPTWDTRPRLDDRAAYQATPEI